MGALTTVVRDEGEGASLVCLHGFPTSSWDFEPMWPGLTAHHRTVAFDLIGLGHASKPRAPMPVALQADLTESVCVARGITEAHLLAHDLGDTVAQELLARQAEGSAKVRWRRVVLLNGGLFPETHHPRLIQRLLISRLGGLVATLSTERTFRRNLTQVFGPHTPPSEDFLRESWVLLERDGGRHALPRLIRYMAERKTHRERWVRPLVDRLVPLRLINGSLDPVSGRHAADRYAELVPDADVVHLPRLGHYPHVEDPPAVLAPVLAWLGAE
ncbi:MAG: alpha/beta hydrolase [Deltaproteobacteria bacterium]|nr:MAG: alpha/beta hydrolase [Deltaproteobacteria bacterium]